MKRFALILCLLGVAFLIAGSVMAVAHPLQVGTHTIPSSGYVVTGPEDPQAEQQSEQTGYQTPLDKIGYVTILLSVGLFSVGLLIHRKRN